MTFKLGDSYTRDEIHEQLGGSKEAYLPTKNGRVVCGAFKREANPQAPLVILPGKGTQIRTSAELFARQNTAIPVFLKKASNAWVYVGDFRVTRLSKDPKEIAEHAARANRTGTVSMVL